MSDTSSNLAPPYLAAGQAQKHVTVNESLLRLDALVQLAVVPEKPVDRRSDLSYRTAGAGRL